MLRFAENSVKPKRRQRVPQQPGLSSEDVAKWEGAPVTTQVARDQDDDSTRTTEIAQGVTLGQKVLALDFTLLFFVEGLKGY